MQWSLAPGGLAPQGSQGRCALSGSAHLLPSRPGLPVPVTCSSCLYHLSHFFRAIEPAALWLLCPSWQPCVSSQDLCLQCGTRAGSRLSCRPSAGRPCCPSAGCWRGPKGSRSAYPRNQKSSSLRSQRASRDTLSSGAAFRQCYEISQPGLATTAKLGSAVSNLSAETNCRLAKPLNARARAPHRDCVTALAFSAPVQRCGERMCGTHTSRIRAFRW